MRLPPPGVAFHFVSPLGATLRRDNREILAYRLRNDTGADRRPRAPAPGARPHRPQVRAAPRCPGYGTCRAHVARALLAQVPGGVWRDALLLSHDTTHRAREGSSASGGVGHRRLRHRRLHVARLVQFALHLDCRWDAVAVPSARPPRPRDRSVVREHDRDPTAAYHSHGLSAADLRRLVGSERDAPEARPRPGTEQDRRSTRRVGARTVVAWQSPSPQCSSPSTTPTPRSAFTATRSASRSATTSHPATSAGSPSGPRGRTSTSSCSRRTAVVRRPRVTPSCRS